jgi:DNA-binding response OmpR family regulator
MLLELRDTVPEMIVLAKEADDVVPLRRSLPGLDATFLEKSNIGALISRVGDLANRVIREAAPVPGIVRMEDCTLDLAAHIFVDAEGREVVLTRAETELLTELVRNLGQILSRDQLRRHWRSRAKSFGTERRSFRSQH